MLFHLVSLHMYIYIHIFINLCVCACLCMYMYVCVCVRANTYRHMCRIYKNFLGPILSKQMLLLKGLANLSGKEIFPTWKRN